MQDRPTSIELLQAAADFVEREIVPITQGQKQFQSRVVANVMRIVAREIEIGEPLLRAEVERARDAAGRAETASSYNERRARGGAQIQRGAKREDSRRRG